MKKATNTRCTVIDKGTRLVSTVASEYSVTSKDLAKLVGIPDDLPENVSVKIHAFVRVPGGGDYSNVDLNIDDHPIQMQVSVTTVTCTEE